jgi:hypothetical protein
VGSEIVGNVDLTGNLSIGPNDFQIKDLTGNVVINNQYNNGNISLFANVNGTSTNVLTMNGSSGLITVLANATNNFGIPTNVYLNSEIQNARYAATVALSTNVAVINANLTARISEEDQLRANLTAANIQIAARATNNRVDEINTATYTALTGNVETLIGNILAAQAQTVAVENSMLANIGIVNANVTAANTNISVLSDRLDSVNLAQSTALVANINTKADIVSATLTGTPVAPTAAFGANTSQIATTQYVMTRAVFWDGSRKFVSSADPDSTLGSDGDIWFKYT